MQDEGDYEGDHPQWAQLWLSARHVCCSQFNCTHSVLQWFSIVLCIISSALLFFYWDQMHIRSRMISMQQKFEKICFDFQSRNFWQMFFFCSKLPSHLIWWIIYRNTLFFYWSPPPHHHHHPVWWRCCRKRGVSWTMWLWLRCLSKPYLEAASGQRWGLIAGLEKRD